MLSKYCFDIADKYGIKISGVSTRGVRSLFSVYGTFSLRMRSSRDYLS